MDFSTIPSLSSSSSSAQALPQSNQRNKLKRKYDELESKMSQAQADNNSAHNDAILKFNTFLEAQTNAWTLKNQQDVLAQRISLFGQENFLLSEQIKMLQAQLWRNNQEEKKCLTGIENITKKRLASVPVVAKIARDSDEAIGQNEATLKKLAEIEAAAAKAKEEYLAALKKDSEG